jgi:hypothetical protein
MVRREEPAMTLQTQREIYNRTTPVLGAFAVAFVAGTVFTGWLIKTPAKATAPAPTATVVTIDSAAITAAVKAAFPAPAPVVTPAKAAPAVATPAKVKRKAKAKPAPVILRTVYFVAPRCGCSI